MSPDLLQEELRELFGSDRLLVRSLGRLEGGFSRETWRVVLDATPDAIPSEVVLRRDAAAGIVQTPLSIEYDLYAALADAGLPLPRVLGVSPEGGRLERPYYVMTMCEGCADPDAIRALDDRGRDRLASDAMGSLARLHSVDPVRVGVLTSAKATGNGPIGQLRHWAGVLESVRLEVTPALDVAVAWLDAHAPASGAAVVVHGDFRTGNLLHRPDGALTAILDWELAHSGSPAEDLAWFCLQRWRWNGDDRVGGLVGRGELMELYRAHGGVVDDAEVRWWEVLGNLKLATFQATSRFRLSKGEGVRLPTIRSSLYLEHQSLFTTEALLAAMEPTR